MDGLLDQFDMLDFVLAVFGALIVSMWFGRGKSLKGLLLGALMVVSSNQWFLAHCFLAGFNCLRPAVMMIPSHPFPKKI